MKNIALFETPTKGSKIIHELLFNLGYRVFSIDGKDIRNMSLSPREYDLIIFPGGAKHIYASISPSFCKKVRAYVESGGNYLGVCGGASLAGRLHLGGVKTNWFGLLPWHIIYELTGKKGMASVTFHPGNIFEVNGKRRITWAASPHIVKLGKCLNIDASYDDKRLLANSLGKPAIVSGEVGKGRVVLFGSHPEYPCPYPDGKNNADLLFKAVEWLLK